MRAEWTVARALAIWGCHRSWCLSLRNVNLPEPCNCGLHEVLTAPTTAHRALRRNDDAR